MAKLSLNGVHADRLKKIRTYVSFNYDLRKPLSAYEKRKIKTYFDALQVPLGRPGNVQVHRPRRDDHLSIAKKATGLGGLRDLKAVPVVSAEKTKIRYTKKAIKLKSEHVTKEFYPVNAADLINDAKRKAIVGDILKTYPKAKRFVLAAQGFESAQGTSRKKLNEFIFMQITTYGDNNILTWLTGVYVFEYKNQTDYDAYVTRREKAREKKALANAAKRARVKRAKKK